MIIWESTTTNKHRHSRSFALFHLIYSLWCGSDLAYLQWVFIWVYKERERDYMPSKYLYSCDIMYSWEWNSVIEVIWRGKVDAFPWPACVMMRRRRWLGLRCVCVSSNRRMCQCSSFISAPQRKVHMQKACCHGPLIKAGVFLSSKLGALFSSFPLHLPTASHVPA